MELTSSLLSIITEEYILLYYLQHLQSLRILILKNPPRMDISNYHPITLISCVSKVLTKMLALSTAIEADDLMGPEQNGF